MCLLVCQPSFLCIFVYQPACVHVLFFSLGLAMDLIEKKNGCQHFSFVHSPQYQNIQFEFLDAVESFNPDNIAVHDTTHQQPLFLVILRFISQAVLQLYPYHIDSLLQLSEVCKMSEDRQMANELIGEQPERHQRGKR